MTETLTNPDEIAQVAAEVRAHADRDFTPEQMQQEFRVNDLDVDLDDLMDTVDF